MENDMAEPKTRETEASVDKFLKGVENEKRREDALTLLKMMKSITRQEPRMWGKDLVGFGSYHYKYASGQEGDWLMTGFSPRKSSLSVYIMPGFEKYPALMKKLGKHKTGKSCLYINKLEDVDTGVLKELIAEAYSLMKKKYK
jgi:hypothetical protein